MGEHRRKVALIPARSGSSRAPGKNVRLLDGHPLIAYSIASARLSGIFVDVFCVTDSEEYANIARHYGARILGLRPTETATATANDYSWVSWIFEEFARAGLSYEFFSILRPTSPFRKPETIQRAWRKFISFPAADSLRAVSLCSQHPAKMWTVNGDFMSPVLTGEIDGAPLHSNPYHSLPAVYVQNASLEIAKTEVLFQHRNISGNRIVPFFSEGNEGFDINSEFDWAMALEIAARPGQLPTVSLERNE